MEAWKDAYEHEQFISDKIRDLLKIAREVNEYSAEPILNWFIDEQIEEESSTSKIYEQVKMLGDNKQGLLLLDRELGARSFPAGSPLDQAAYNSAE